MIIANWKMYGSMGLLQQYIERFSKKKFKRKLITCPPYPLLLECAKYLKTGAQNCYLQESGAFTGEVSPTLLKEIGCQYVLLGHSERRQHFEETDNIIAEKAEIAFDQGIIPIVCVGTNVYEFEDEIELLYDQIKLLPEEIWLAYEPLWSIGTDKLPSASYVKNIVEWLKDQTGTTHVFYGGSVTPETAPPILKVCDGALIGRASLQVDLVESLLTL